ncbi:MAG TPA: hypothetical protein VD767_06630 [Thermomicrobiales bacterium]|nr:hypothetical protein [Thermomicrobiales bacterium]
MQITLPPEAQAIVDRELESGRFASIEEVVIKAIMKLDDEDPDDSYDDRLALAREQADRGEGRELTEAVMQELLSRARSDAQQGRPVRNDVTY